MGGAGISSRAIEWFSAAPFSHVAAVWSPTEYLDAHADTIAGIKPGVQIRPQLIEVADLKVMMQLDMKDWQITIWRSFLQKQIGLPYDKPGIIGFATGRDWREPDSWFCSELQAAALEACGRCPKLYTPNNKITPGALANIVSALGGQTA
jgi:hypothetical protein